MANEPIQQAPRHDLNTTEVPSDAAIPCLADKHLTASAAMKQLLAAVEVLPIHGNEELFVQCFSRLRFLSQRRGGDRSGTIDAARAWLKNSVELLSSTVEHIQPALAAEIFFDVVNKGWYREHLFNSLSKKAETDIATLPARALRSYLNGIAVSYFSSAEVLNIASENWQDLNPRVSDEVLVQFFYTASVLEHPVVASFLKAIQERDWQKCNLSSAGQAYHAACGCGLEAELPPMLSPDTNLVLSQHFEKFTGKSPSSFQRVVSPVIDKLLLDYPGSLILAPQRIRGFSPDFLIVMNDLKLAFECDGPRGHFLVNEFGEYRQTGNDRLMEKIVARDGWKVVRIRSYEWNESGAQLVEERLRKELETA